MSDILSGKGRGKPPTPNKAHTKKKRIEQIVEATMDVYRVESIRQDAVDQLERFEKMAKGDDGGRLRPGHTDTIRDMHYKGWRDSDFKKIAKLLKEAMEKFDETKDDTKK